MTFPKSLGYVKSLMSLPGLKKFPTSFSKLSMKAGILIISPGTEGFYSKFKLFLGPKLLTTLITKSVIYLNRCGSIKL